MLSDTKFVHIPRYVQTSSLTNKDIITHARPCNFVNYSSSTYSKKKDVLVLAKHNSVLLKNKLKE